MSGKAKRYGALPVAKGEGDPLLLPSGGGGEKKAAGDRQCYRSSTTYVDHFSLEAPSDEIRFRTSAVRVYGSWTEQFQLVEEEEEEEEEEESTKTGERQRRRHCIKAKVTSDGSSGLSMLRAGYTLVAVLMMGFLLIFCLQVLLFLFVSLIMEGGFTSKQELNWFHLFGTVLSIPVFVYGLASALTMASEFVLDTWTGHHFFRSILRWNAVYIDWIAFAVFLGIPLVVMIARMFTNEYWWEATALTWFSCVAISYALFCFAVFVYEIWGALELLSHHPSYENTSVSIRNWLRLLKRAVLLRQLHTYSGVRHRTFYIEGARTLPTPNESYTDSKLADHEHVQEKVKLWCKFTQLLPNCMFYEYGTPKRQYNIEDVLDRTVFVTDATWNLEKLFCRRKAARTMVVVNGPSRVTDPQVMSSLICAILGNGLFVLTFAALLTWAGVPVLGVLGLVALLLFVARNSFVRIYAIYDTYWDTRNRRLHPKHGRTFGSEAIYQVTETHRVTRPTEELCWILFGLELIGLFILPVLVLFQIGNNAIAILFLILGLFSACRHYFNAPVVLSELGSLDLLDGQFMRSRNVEETGPEAEEKDWREKNRLSKIVAKISQGARRDMWIAVIASFVVIFLLLFLSAYHNGSNAGSVEDAPKLLHDFRYVRQEGFAYPTCSMTPDFQIPKSPTSALADYAYLASIAYVAPQAMPSRLDGWFGQGVAYDDFDLVTKYRQKVEGAAPSAVHYKLITFPDDPDFAVLTIRGTQNGWDMLSDAQLWSAAFLAQMVRWLIPVGEVWNPILENLVKVIAILQGPSLKKVSFYVQTSGFVEWLRKEQLYKSLRVSGHSLGGGLAMITGAQTKTPAIALSGPNTMISRDTMEPPVTVDDLNKYTFNIIPDRDVVPMIDDRAMNYQRISCLAESNNFVDCHTSLRSLCDILHTCGTGPRPALCECALLYGYPEPEPTGNRTFAEACK
jgi:lipase ATG15